MRVFCALEGNRCATQIAREEVVGAERFSADIGGVMQRLLEATSSLSQAHSRDAGVQLLKRLVQAVAECECDGRIESSEASEGATDAVMAPSLRSECFGC
jgi:hypothetical protein